MIIVHFRRHRMDNQNNKGSGPNNNRQGWGVILVTTLLVTFVVMGLYSLMQGSNPEEISYDKFLELVDDNKVDEVTLGSTRIYITLKKDAQNEDNSSAQGTGMNNIINQIEQQAQEGAGGEREPDYYTGVVMMILWLSAWKMQALLSEPRFPILPDHLSSKWLSRSYCRSFCLLFCSTSL